jgi:glycosyltransferase involved in cell wall biosynthesis
MPLKPQEVVIIIPSYNEGARILQVVTAILDKGYRNIVVIDDGSSDNSMELISGLDVVILRHLVNRGAGAATETGLKYCRDILRAETVVMIDADTQHDVEDIGKLIEAHFEQQADITIGNRFLENTENIPVKNWIYNQIANVVTGVFAGKWISDSQSGFKVFNNRALNRIVIEHDTYEHCSEIFIKAHEYGLKIIDVPIRVHYTEEIKDKGQHFLNGVRTFINLLYSAMFKNKQR